GAVEVGVRGEGDGRPGEGDHAVQSVGDRGDGEGVAVGVAVVGQQGARLYHQRRVLVGGGAVVYGEGQIVGGVQREYDGAGDGAAGVGAGAAPVSVPAGRASDLGAVEVGVRGEGDGRAGEGDHAVQSVGDRGDGEGVAVGVGVVGQQGASLYQQRGVLVGGG